ncbi:DUF1905 domain-containing protein [Candidatus Saccharibacteria bacterium]|nr:DUF1905 domain-containing protein [Candidatus Saccharibacteria bacterium]MCL1963297.1 DUF1905 domain-containing protein [Candidatus Saccharibacteria bacterium]
MAEKFSGIVEVCGDEAGYWHIVRVPEKVSGAYKSLAINFGFIPVTLTVGKSSWSSSFMPAGDGTHIIAVPTKVRKANNIQLGDKISVEFEMRERK